MHVVDVLAVLAGAGLLAVAGLAAALTLRVAGAAELLLAAYLAAAGTAIVVIETLSARHWVTRAGLLAGAAAAAAVATGAWVRAGRPGPRAGPLPTRRELARGARAHPLVAALAAAAALATLTQLVLAVAVAPNEIDGLLYHLLRSARVMQAHSVVPPGPILRGDPATMNPANAELLVAWTMVLSHVDRLAGLVQWTCLPALGLLILAGARRLGYGTAASVFAAAVAVLLPEPLLQATTVQTDLMLSVLIGCVALFATRGVAERATPDLAVAGVALGLAVGTKSSALLASVFVGILVLAAAWRSRAPAGVLLRAGALAAAGTIVLGSFAYVDDFAQTGDPLGGVTHSTTRDFTRAGAPLNVARSAWSAMVEAPGLPRSHALEEALDPLRSALYDHLRGSYYTAPTPVRFDIDEDTNGVGLVGLLVLVPLLAAALVRPRRGAERLLALCGLGFAAVLSATLGYSPDNARLVLPGIVLTLPLLARAAARPWSRIAVVALAVVSAVPAVLLNPHRSPFTDPNLLTEGRHGQQLSDYGAMADLIDALDATVAPTAPIGVLNAPEFTYSEHPAYPLYDAHLRRRVVLLRPRDITPARLRALGLRGAVVWPARCAGPDCRMDVRRFPARVNLGNQGWFIPARARERLRGGNGTS